MTPKETPPAPPAPTTPREIAASVEKSDDLRAAEAERLELEQRRADLRKELDVTEDQFSRFRTGAEHLGQLLLLEQDLGEKVAENRRQLLALRRGYGEEVAAALQPTAAAAANRILAGMAEANAGLADLAAAEKARSDAECRTPRTTLRLDARAIEVECRRVLAAGDGH